MRPPVISEYSRRLFPSSSSLRLGFGSDALKRSHRPGNSSRGIARGGTARTLDEMRAKIALLHSKLDAVSGQVPLSRQSSPDSKSSLTSTDKVKLFRSLFRGRTDVFPLRFVSAAG